MKPYYSDGAVTIYHGDCREVLPQLVIDNPGMVLTDPPYGIGVRYGSGSDDSRADYWPWMRETVEVMRTVAPVLVFTHRVAALRELHGWDWIGAWRKPIASGVGVGNSPVVPHWEPIFMYGIHTLGTTDRVFTPDVFSFNAEKQKLHGLKGRESWAKADAEGHPAPKPEGLWRSFLTAFGQAGGTVIDPFLGSGTTLRVAKDAGRKAIGIEIEERFCDYAARRCAQEVLAA